MPADRGTATTPAAQLDTTTMRVRALVIGAAARAYGAPHPSPLRCVACRVDIEWPDDFCDEPGCPRKAERR